MHVILKVRPGDQLELRPLDSLPAAAKLSLSVEEFANPENAKPGWKAKFLTQLLEYERPNILSIERLETADYEHLLTLPTNRNIDLGFDKSRDKELEKRLQDAGYYLGHRLDQFFEEW